MSHCFHVFAKFVLFICPRCNHGDRMFWPSLCWWRKITWTVWQTAVWTRSPSAPSPPPRHSSVMKTCLFLWCYWPADRRSDPGLPAPTRRGLGLAASRRGTSRIGCLTSPSSENGPERNQTQSPVQQNSRLCFHVLNLCWCDFSLETKRSHKAHPRTHRIRTFYGSVLEFTKTLHEKLINSCEFVISDICCNKQTTWILQMFWPERKTGC